MLRAFTAAAGMGLADMNNDKQPNRFLKGGLVDGQYHGESNNIDGDDSAGMTREVSTEGNDNQTKKTMIHWQ
jgi:hypothetical protein